MTPQTATATAPSAPAAPPAESGSYECTIYIASTAEKVWSALTQNEVRKHWWRGHTVDTDWKPGSELIGRFPDGSLEFKGHVLEAESPRRLAFQVDEVSWSEDLDRDGPSRLAFTLEGFRSLVKLTLRNEARPRMLALVSQGWPAVLSSLKSLLETGTPLPLDEVFGPEGNPGTRQPAG
jgi:uncharacterized protein YndB with AHSA1/START domain